MNTIEGLWFMTIGFAIGIMFDRLLWLTWVIKIKMKTNYKIMREVIEENTKHPKGAGDQILEALKRKDKEISEFIEDNPFLFIDSKAQEEFVKKIK